MSQNYVVSHSVVSHSDHQPTEVNPLQTPILSLHLSSDFMVVTHDL